MIRNIVFDLGRVLVDFEPLLCMQKLGFSEEAVKAFRKEIFPGLWEACDQYPYGYDEIRDLFRSKVPGFEKEVDLLWENLPVITGSRMYAETWIRELKRRGYRVYILSNYGKQSFRINSPYYEFLPLADGAVLSYEVEMLKPDPGIYRALCEKYGLKPEESVFIDDREENTAAAGALGFRTVTFVSYEQAWDELEALFGKEKND